jgi:inosine-uridine nucleoside N-ribohydrolase
MASPGEITLVALGPLTNGTGAQPEPRLASALAELIVMAVPC